MSVLVGCVEVPAPILADNTAPLITLESTTLLAYPGTTFQVDATIEDAESDVAELKVSWQVMSEEATILEQSNEVAQFSIDLQANAGQQIVVVARVSDPKGLSAETTIAVDIQAEPSVVVDAKTDVPALADQDPIYTIGVYSGRRVNIKSQDTLASTNYLID